MHRLGLFAGCALCAVLLLSPAACSSGGGGTARVTITANNAMEVTGWVLGATDFLIQFSQIAVEFTEVFDDGGGSRTVPCPPGGGTDVEIDVTDVAPLNEISTGDSATLAFNGCEQDLDGELVTFTGTVSISVTSYTDVPPNGFNATISFSFQNLVLAFAGETNRLSGGFVVEASTTDDIEFDWVVRGTSLRATMTGPGFSESVTISNFRVEMTTNDATGAFTADTQGTVSATAIGGSVSYETTVTFVGTGASEDPETGELMIYGAGNSEIRLETVDAINVRLHVDEDGDGTPEDVINTTWNDVED